MLWPLAIRASPVLTTNLLVFQQLQRPCSEGLVVKDTYQATLFKCHVVLAQCAHVLALGAGVGVVQGGILHFGAQEILAVLLMHLVEVLKLADLGRKEVKSA